MSTTIPPALPVGTIVRAPSDELDLSSTASLHARLSAAHAPGALVLLDLEGVTFLDSAALAVVLAAECRLHAEGGVLALINVEERVLRILRICGLAERLVCKSGQALTAWPAQAAWRAEARSRRATSAALS